MSGEAVYLDSSAIVKLVVHEQESDALGKFLAGRPIHVSCALAWVEVLRAIRPHGTNAVVHAKRMLRNMRLLRLHNALLDDAAGLDPLGIRSLDAIHLAAVRALGSSLSELVTYDLRMAAAAERLGIAVAMPGSGGAARDDLALNSDEWRS